MTLQLGLLPGHDEHVGADALERHYCPPGLARLLVGLLPIEAPHVVCEPHVGGGSFVQAVMALGVGSGEVIACDLDPEATGLAMAAVYHVGSFLETDLQPDWHVGNPPFSNAIEHAEHAIAQARVGVAFLMPIGKYFSTGRSPFWEAHPARVVYAIPWRVWPHVRECAFFVWRTGYHGPTELRRLA